MWKYVTRRFRETFERSANHFDKRPTTNVVNATNIPEEKHPCSGGGPPPCPMAAWFRQKKCARQREWRQARWHSNNNRWNFEQLNRSWIGAITWSSALALGWYTSQFVHMKIKHKHAYRDGNRCTSVNNILNTLKPYVNSVNQKALTGNSTVKLEKILEDFTPTVHLVANEQSGVKEPTSPVSTTPSTDSESDLGDVLNSIENRLGLAAIESGQHQVGLNLLRSAANRHHAPAMFNLGLCYEMGLGVTINEKMAMELYKSAAALQHPGALYNLGIYYGQGRGGLGRDLETATRLLRLAAVQGQRDAIEALKSLDIEPESPRVEIDDTWINHHNPLLMKDSVLPPTPTTLFVENVLFAPTHHKSKATVY